MTDAWLVGGGQSAAGLTASQLGNKGANLARLDRLGLRIPPAIAFGTALHRAYTERGCLPDDFRAELALLLRQLEQLTVRVLGRPQPLLLSVRSSPAVSMPGMLETVVDVGVNEDTVRGLILRTGNPWMAWDTYRRFVRSFGGVVAGVPDRAFDTVERCALAAAGAACVDDLDPLALRDSARALADVAGGWSSDRLPPDTLDQLVLSVDAVLRSWNAPKARTYREISGIDHETGTGVLIQSMVFGNAGPRSGSGVGFTRNPATGADELYIDFAFNAQGDDVVSGRDLVSEPTLIAQVLPSTLAELEEVKALLEREFRDAQDFEFTVEEGRLYILQTRSAKRTAWAALQIAVDMVSAGLIDPATALLRLAAYDLDTIQRRAAQPGPESVHLATGVPASAGAAAGTIALTSARAETASDTAPAILVRRDLTTDDIGGMSTAAGLLTAVGGRTSHAAVVARQLDKPCVVGCAGLQIDEPSHTCIVGNLRLAEGDWITVDGDTGDVYSGAVPVVAERPHALLDAVRAWSEALTG